MRTVERKTIVLMILFLALGVAWRTFLQRSGISFVHEASHVLAAALTGGGGSILSGSMAETRGGWGWLIDVAGYSGEMLFFSAAAVLLSWRYRYELPAFFMGMSVATWVRVVVSYQSDLRTVWDVLFVLGLGMIVMVLSTTMIGCTMLTKWRPRMYDNVYREWVRQAT